MSTVLNVLAWGVLFLAALPAAMVAVNLARFRKLPTPTPGSEAKRSHDPADGLPGAKAGVSVLIPARDEQAAIGPCLDAVIAAAEGVDLEIVVLDDHSEDDTAAIVQRLADTDPRVKLIQGQPLPAGHNGKQHACWQLAQAANRDVLTWIDADVRLQPRALSRLLREAHANPARLLSGFPKQRTDGLMEKLIIPQIQAVLLGYLPIARMRKSVSPGFGAGCGQWFAAHRAAYFEVGGHGAIARCIHDGIALPRLFRRGGHLTDIFDASDTASCKMYDTAGQVWNGFAKNATAGMAAPGAIGIWTSLLLGGWVLPWVMLGLYVSGVWTPASGGFAGNWVAWVPAVFALGTTIALGVRFRQGLAATLLRPAGIAALLAIQWHALWRKLRGTPANWRGRSYAAA
ncbi:MAG: glycosyltransferase family 2 protein [Planctomycetota bacterium]